VPQGSKREWRVEGWGGKKKKNNPPADCEIKGEHYKLAGLTEKTERREKKLQQRVNRPKLRKASAVKLKKRGRRERVRGAEKKTKPRSTGFPQPAQKEIKRKQKRKKKQKEMIPRGGV